MELRIKVGYNDILEVIKKMPGQQLDLLLNDIAKFKAQKEEVVQPKPKYDKDKFRDLILSGPVETEEDLHYREEVSKQLEGCLVRSF